MAWNEIEICKIEKMMGVFCSEKNHPAVTDKLRYDYIVEKQSVFVREIRPVWIDLKQFTGGS